MSGPPHEEKRTEKLPNEFGPYYFTPVGDRADRGDSYLQRRAGQQAPDEMANAKAPKASGDRTAQPPKSPLTRRRREPDTDAGEKQEPEGQMPGPKRTGNGKGQKAPRKPRRAKRKRSGRKRPGTAGNPARYKPKFREE